MNRILPFRSARLGLSFAFALTISGCLSGGGGSSSEVEPLVNTLSVAITSPDATEIDTADETIDLAGIVDSEAPVSSVSWTNDLGGEGEASGTDNWQVSDIPLALGSNRITVTALDDAGNSSTDTISVNRESNSPGSVTLSWVAPTERADGTPLTELAGYRVYYGRMSETYDYEIEVSNPGLVTYVVENLVPGDWYFVVAAFDSEGLESEPSNEVHHKLL